MPSITRISAYRIMTSPAASSDRSPILLEIPESCNLRSNSFFDMQRARWILAVLIFWPGLRFAQRADPIGAPYPGSRVLLDAHNCYPYGEWWKDRIDRVLSTGLPLAIEQDLAWYTDPRTGRAWSVLSHEAAATGSEPTLKEYFFERDRKSVV